MEKILQPSSGVDNVGLGQTATHNFRKGPSYHHMTYIVTIGKTALTAGFTSPTLSDALGALEVRINTETKRSLKAIELDTIQQAWSPNFAVIQLDGIGNDLITAIPDVVTTGSTASDGYAPSGTIPINSTRRVSTFLFTIYFAEAFRTSYVAQRFFALPTLWPNGKTVDVQVALNVPNNAGIAAPTIRAEEFIDFTKGPHQKTLANGAPDTASPAVLPMVNFWAINKNYSATDFSITDWGNVRGKLQQISLFGQAADYLTKYKLKADNVPKRDTTKVSNDQLNQKYEWDFPIPNITAPYDKANVTHIALDTSDDVTDWLNFDNYGSIELAMTLNQVAATNKVVRAIVQAYDVYILPA